MVPALLLLLALQQDAVVEQRRVRFPALYDLVERSDAVPPDYSAHALLRAAGSSSLTDRAWKRELIETAFGRAASAGTPVRLDLTPGMDGSSRASAIAQAGKLGFDRLTLQASAVIAMTALDATRARDLFERIVYPAPAPLACKDALWPTTAIWYEALRAVTDTAFTGAERAREEQFLYFQAGLSRVRHILEIGPALKAARETVSLTADQRAIVIGKLAGVLESLQSSDRDFMTGLYPVDNEVKRLAQAYPALGAAWRKYLGRQYSGPRCGEAGDAKYDKFFAGPADHWGLSEEEREPASIGASADRGSQADHPAISLLRKKWFELMAGNQRTGLNDEQKRTPEWLEQFDRHLNAIEDLKAEPGQPEADLHQAKMELLMGLVWATPAGSGRDRVLARYLSYVTTSPSRRQDWVWFAGIEALVRLSAITQGAGQGGLLDVFEQSGDPVLALYARLERAKL